MKRLINPILGGVALLLSLSSCNDFINVEPNGVADEDYVFGQPEQMTTAAYAMLGDDWYTYPFNLWPYGDVISDDCYKGGGSTGDVGEYHQLDIMSSLVSTAGPLDELWYRLYCAISRCNKALISLEQADEANYPEKEKRIGEVRFLRGHFYFKLLTLFRQVPWVDEQVVKDGSVEKTSNTQYTNDELWQKVMDDFKAAYDVLDTYPEDPARVSKTAAACYLAKCYLNLAYPEDDKYQFTGTVNKEYMQKVIDYTDFVLHTATKYGYATDFGDIFMPDQRNGVESIFAVQHSLDDNTVFGRANWSNTLNAPWGLFACGWDFHKPSQNLVDAFKTENGLPEFDTYDDVASVPVPGGSTEQKFDPRLFHTVAINGFPYKYDVNTLFTYANNRTPNTYGYYSSLKENVPVGSKYTTYNGSWQATNQNDYVFRYTDVMLWRAEAYIELGQADQALPIINAIRMRAANSVDKYIPYAKDFCDIKPYPSFPSQEYARQALRWERRLEMAMESSRFFDLRRWGIAAQTLNKYYAGESDRTYTYVDDGGKTVKQMYAEYYKDAHFTAGKNEYMPIPYNQLNYIPGLYTQNAGYE